MKHTDILIAVMLLSLSACEKPGQSTYKASELGISRAVEFGTIIDMKEVAIVGETNQAGEVLGGTAGLAAGSQVGTASGNVWSDVGGVVAGAVAGSYIEQKLRNSTGYQYILTMQSGDTKTIALEKKDGDEVLKPGDKVMMQYCDLEYNKKCKAGDVYQRLIKVDNFPPLPHDAKKHHHHDDDDDDHDDDKKT